MRRKEKIGIIVLSLMLMTSAFAACGGGGSGGESSGASQESENTGAEPNSGIRGIVFAVPEEWTLKSASDYNISFEIPDSDFTFSASATSDDVLKDEGLPDELKSDTMEEFFEKAFKASDEVKKRNNLQQSEMKICDTDAYYTERRTDDGKMMSAGAAWLYDGIIYDLSLGNYEAYDEQGNFKEGSETLTDDKIEALKAVLVSVKPGDGAAMMSEALKAGFIGSLSFDVPEGYAVKEKADSYLSMEKEGSAAKIHINRIDDESLKALSEADGENYATLKDYFDGGQHDESETRKIADCDGYINKYPDEDGKYYNVLARLTAEDAIYEISMDTDAYDENGLKADAIALTDDDMAEFEALLDSMKKK